MLTYELLDPFFQSFTLLFSDKHVLFNFLAIGVQFSFPSLTTSDSGAGAGVVKIWHPWTHASTWEQLDESSVSSVPSRVSDLRLLLHGPHGALLILRS